MTNEMKCRCCGQSLRQQTQGTKPAKVNGEIVFTSSITIVDCLNPDCPLYYVTREANAYAAMDLAPYLNGGAA